MEERHARTWQAWVNLLVEVVFGTDYDAPLKLAVKLSKPVDQALDMPGTMMTSGDPLADGVFEFLVRKKAICH